MICALTVRRLKPGTFDEFRTAFMARNDPDDPPEGWVRFDMVRNTDDPDEVICFGFYDGSVEELRASAGQEDYAEQQRDISEYVESVGADGLYEIVEEYSRQPAAG
jgi:heme-degrading monooxygenase HmoA